MKTNRINTIWSALRVVTVCLASAICIAGCGAAVDLGDVGGSGSVSGGGGSIAGVGTGGTGTIKASVAAVCITGMVADGDRLDAIVFLDKDGNYQIDVGDPFVAADATGTYRLNVDPADVGIYPIVVVATPKGTVNGATDMDAAHGYLFSRPKQSIYSTGDNFVGPVTALLREMMESGQYTTLHQAVEIWKARMMLPPNTDMFASYSASENRSLYSIAQQITAVMDRQMAQVLHINGLGITVDVTRYRIVMGMIADNAGQLAGINAQADMNLLNDMIVVILDQQKAN